MNVNPLRDIWKQGRAAVGTYIMYSRDITTIEIAAAGGLDFVLFDLEHRPQSSHTVHDLCQVARLAGVAPIVGPKDISQHAISHALDLGASGVVVPHVQTIEDVTLAIDAVRYPTVGKRGRCGTGGHDLYRPAGSADDEITHYNEQVALLLKVESRTAIDRIDELLSPDGVDGVMVGPSDLALDLGLGGESTHPDVISCINKVRSSCLHRGIQYGTFIGSTEDLSMEVEQGASWIVVSSEMGFLSKSWKQISDEAKRCQGGRSAP